MKRLETIKNYLIEAIKFKPEQLEISFDEAKTSPRFQRTGTGITLYELGYKGTIELFDVTQDDYLYLGIILADWFRKNGEDKEEWEMSGESDSDQLSIVEITLTLLEKVHLEEDPTGPIERNEIRYKITDIPAETGL